VAGILKIQATSRWEEISRYSLYNKRRNAKIGNSEIKVTN
jgi:hypothetical protein